MNMECDISYRLRKETFATIDSFLFSIHDVEAGVSFSDFIKFCVLTRTAIPLFQFPVLCVKLACIYLIVVLTKTSFWCRITLISTLQSCAHQLNLTSLIIYRLKRKSVKNHSEYGFSFIGPYVDPQHKGIRHNFL